MIITTNQLNIIESFIMGGCAVSITSWLGTHMNPLIAAIFWSYPLTILPTLYIMEKTKKTNKYISQFLVSTTFALILLMLVTFVMARFIRNSENKSIWIPIMKATGVWFISGIAFYYTIKYTGLDKHFM